MAGSEILERVAAVLSERRRERPAGSYVTSLLDGGHPAIAAKLREESEELIEATGSDSPDAGHVAREAADLFFHALVLLCHADVPLEATFDELDRRFGTGGHVEKARRRRPQASQEGSE